MPSSQVCYKQPGPPPPTASCYICLENSEESNNQPLLRNCACRGDDAGWAHVACLAEFAASQVTEAQNQEHSVDIGIIWKNCILCKTPYMQNMGLAMAKACAKHYEYLPDTNKLRILSLEYMASINVDLGNHNDAMELFNHLLKIFKIVTEQGRDVRRMKTYVLGGMFLVYMRERRFNDAIAAKERDIEITTDLDGSDSWFVRDKKRMLTMAQTMIGDECDHKMDTATELVKARQRFKETQSSKDMDTRLLSHFMLVHALGDDGKPQEARKQLENLISESRRVNGPDHPVTLQYENTAKDYRLKIHQAAEGAETQKNNIWAVIDYETKKSIHGQRVKVLKATKKDAGIYICQIQNHNGVSTRVKVVHDQFILETGTAVAVHGLVSSKDLNGSIGIIQSFDKEIRRYAVSVGTKKAPVLIKPINLNVVFA